jgi:hypothetical protein
MSEFVNLSQYPSSAIIQHISSTSNEEIARLKKQIPTSKIQPAATEGGSCVDANPNLLIFIEGLRGNLFFANIFFIFLLYFFPKL